MTCIILTIANIHPTLRLITGIVPSNGSFSQYLPQCCYVQKIKILICYEILNSSNLHGKNCVLNNIKKLFCDVFGGSGEPCCPPRDTFKQYRITNSAHKHIYAPHTQIHNTYKVETMGNERNRKLKHRGRSGMATPKEKCVSVEQ